MADPRIETESKLRHDYVTENETGRRKVSVTVSEVRGALIVTQLSADLLDDGTCDMATHHGQGVILEPATVEALIDYLSRRFTTDQEEDDG